MSIRQITIVGTGLIGGSLGLALKKHGFSGKITGCDRAQVLERARAKGTIDHGITNLLDAVRGSQIVVLATPVRAIIGAIRELAPTLPRTTLLTDVGSTKAEVVNAAKKSFAKSAAHQFLAAHPMAGKEQAGVEFADADLFTGAAWFITPLPSQKISGLAGEYLEWIATIGARIAILDAGAHDKLCAWISHLPQMISTALAAALVEEFGEDTPLLEAGGRALREATRISGSPYSMWRDIAATNTENIRDALIKLEHRLKNIRESLDNRNLENEFELAHRLKKVSTLGNKAIEPRNK